MFILLHETSFHSEKFEDTDFENDNSFFKFQSKIPKYNIFLENSKVFFKVKIWVNLFLFSQTWLLISKRFCYCRIGYKLFSNRTWEIIFHNRWIINWIALVLKTCVFNISWEEKRNKEIFEKLKYRKTGCKYLLSFASVIVFLQAFSIVFCLFVC